LTLERAHREEDMSATDVVGARQLRWSTMAHVDGLSKRSAKLGWRVTTLG
jgi:hypothetical protein